MKKLNLKFAITILFVLLYNFSVALESPEKIKLQKAADDMKFQNGLEFFNLERYDRALNEFKEYLEIYYGGSHRAEAYRKIAEIYIKKYDYQRAVNAYISLYQEYGDTEEGLDAYFQAGVCYRKMGMDEKAKSIFEQIFKEYPGTSAAQKAEMQLELLKIEN
ncbi:MAG TPA: tetratricopeptide repeat protein [Spirochaetota bacterium]|jgi:TolA-binding protein|nr:tetratricopeptide repeat protein [Spirochaetota bacterium]OQA96714.1 MAG: tol-pal system protein YbgF [Spirochaetes bacterium ADurb.Bin218]HOK00924.1 tetratricopeptide repeat protein [Spirochaetota bacterium]HOK91260.1 tetratricopeptide repeat protein [Spirochaetota bacterium]HON17023.1 tetratricopeptide repeat protein [Spirochaetota bacterium]